MIRKCLSWVRDLTQSVLGPAQTPQPLEIEACWLEDRLLYSATALPVDLINADAAGLGYEVTQAEIDALMNCVDAELSGGNAASSVDADTDLLSPASNEAIALHALPDANLQQPDVGSSDESTSARMEVAFVDSGLDNLQDLLDQLQATYDNQDTTLEVVLIDRQTSGVEQITSFLAAAEHDYSSIHLVTHGSSGQFQLGSDWINVETLDSYSPQLAMWQSSLTDDADLLVYGCQVASTDDGQQLGMELAQLLDVDVAMSTDATGAGALGADWDLEFQTGVIETQSQVVVESPDEWQGKLATYTVTNTNNSGAGSLRQAIIDANNNAGADTINFSISSGVQTITITSLLPSITGQVTIDGTTQTGFAGTPLIVITGGGTVSDGFQLYTGSDNSTIKGLVIRSFTQDGIDIASSNGNTIVGNYIGIAQSGLSSSGNQQGVNIWAASNNVIGGSTAAERNIISGNSATGVWIGGGGTGNQVRGNYIGTNYLGTGSLQNGSVGVYIDSANNTIGGTTSGYGNVISGNTGATGVSLTSQATGSVVQGNIIGLNASGSAALANTTGMSVAASNVTIGGTTAAARNIISGNSGTAITVSGSGNTFQGNYIGVDTTGLVKIANGNYGIDLTPTATNTTIGGATSGARNIISGNGNAGVLFQSGSSGSVLGNYLGVDATGATSIAGNGAAVYIATSNVKVGGVNAGEGNIISGSNTDGVLLTGTTTGNSILGNSIFGNSGQAIDLNDDGVTLNDLADGDTGPNSYQNFPVLKTATTTNGNTTITGKLNSTANTTYRIEFFSNAYGTADTTGYGEARTYLGSSSVTTDANGNATINATLNGVSLITGSTVTATATVDLSGGVFGSTSEFGGNIMANQANLMITGTYTGNGLDNRAFTGLGFRPEAVIVIHGASTQAGVLRTSSMAGDASKLMIGATGLTANLIQSLDGEGFTLGNDAAVNTNAQVYHWIAFGAGDNIDVGSYTGNGTSQTIAGVGFQAELTYLASAGTAVAGYNSSLSVTNTNVFSNSSTVTTGVTGYTSDGFTVGASVIANQSSTAIHYIAFNQDANYFVQGTYTGNATDNRNITGLGFEPEFMTVRRVGGTSYTPFKTESTGYNTDGTIYADATGNYTNSIQALQTDGFQVGGDAEVNGSGVTFAYHAFKQRDAALVVDTTSDSTTGSDTTSINALRASRGADGKISLREAIAATNATRNVNGTPNEIDFAISGSGVRTITIGTTGLAAITDAVVIDAWTQSGWNNSPLIELDGGNSGTLKDGFQLASGSSGSTIRGFIINRFTGDGIEVNSSNNNVIEGNWIGLSNTGTSASANALRGIHAINSTGLTIGGTTTASRNVISGNTQQGIYFDNVDNSFIYGNYIGTNAAGTGDVNGSSGNSAQSGFVLLNGSSGNTIGGTTSAHRNVVSGNNHYGIEIQSLTSINNIAQGNYIGTDASGLVALGNVGGGFSFWGSGTGNVLGGNASGAGNVIAGNTGNNVLVGSGASGSTIQGNYIGLGSNGSTGLSSSAYGIYVQGSAINTLIGTNADGTNDTNERNIISGNTDGIFITDVGTTGTVVAGNYIGTNAAGTAAVGNSGDGVRIVGGATSTTIGGSTSTRRNVISGNSGDGIQIDGETTDGNTIQNNYIGCECIRHWSARKWRLWYLHHQRGRQYGHRRREHGQCHRWQHTERYRH